jgi:diguanylate cyclase (GGDEF)-like protein/PAS domain S-box-containing protein
LWTHLAGVVAILVVGGVFGYRLTDQIRQREQLAAEHRLLADNATDLVLRLGRDLRQLYVSPSCLQLLGYQPADLLGQTPEVVIEPQDWPAAALAFRALLDPSGAPRAMFEYRCRHRDGAEVWLEASARRLDDPEGLVVSCRDISLRKDIEARLEEMTVTDALTGLINRRGFDDGLNRALRRAGRAGQSLALIMVDVDMFKSYNDTYGHPAGDECLQAIAVVIASAGQRPDDMAARYGGEELSMVLPDTGIHGAVQVAEAARKAVASLAIPHAGSPLGIVTISLGVAAVEARHADMTGKGLIKAADEALYAAKHSGRNTVRMASGAFAAGAPAVRADEFGAAP